MKNYSENAIHGLQALKRAVAKVYEDARKNHYKLPVWRNGRVEYVMPGEKYEKEKSAHDV